MVTEYIVCYSVIHYSLRIYYTIRTGKNVYSFSSVGTLDKL